MSFTGAGAAQYSADAKREQERSIREGGTDSIDAAGKKVDASQEELEDKRTKNMFVNALVQQSQANGAAGGGMSMPFLRHQQTGYAGLAQPELMQKGTIQPFDKRTDTTRNYNGIVNGYDPRLFMASTQIKQKIESMEPYARRVLQDRTSLYTGVSPDFAVNDVNIQNQRIRENQMYAFV